MRGGPRATRHAPRATRHAPRATHHQAPSRRLLRQNAFFDGLRRRIAERRAQRAAQAGGSRRVDFDDRRNSIARPRSDVPAAQVRDRSRSPERRRDQRSPSPLRRDHSPRERDRQHHRADQIAAAARRAGESQHQAPGQESGQGQKGKGKDKDKCGKQGRGKGKRGNDRQKGGKDGKDGKNGKGKDKRRY